MNQEEQQALVKLALGWRGGSWSGRGNCDRRRGGFIMTIIMARQVIFAKKILMAYI